MVKALIERAWVWLHATFPERQIYVRSDGRVQFFTFGAPLQATLAGLCLILLSWFAFASVNVIFKDRIVAAKDHRFQQMQANYENRIADLQISYDELNGALVAAQDKFKGVADQVQLKQRALVSLLTGGNGSALTIAESIGSSVGSPIANVPRMPSAGGATNDLNYSRLNVEGVNGASELDMMPEAVGPQPRTGSPSHASLILGGTFRRLASAADTLFRKPIAAPSGGTSKVALQNPAFRGLIEQTQRLENLDRSEMALLENYDAKVGTRIAGADGVLSRVGLNPNRLEGAVGGPLVPISDVKLAGIQDSGFTNAFVTADAHYREFGVLLAALNHVPLTTPVHGAGFELTSDFGPRIDPFTHRAGFHPGLDFGGHWGALVTATAPGTVVFAGGRGGYGNMVEIDHGYGMHTRYGHLSSILVRVGAKVAKGAPVGKLGSTGRSTGPHVHYEVWLADVVRDPSRFIEAGRHVH
jgi:murein DD-endopeptidase MepM/ murein hydrolase activator NlpD